MTARAISPPHHVHHAFHPALGDLPTWVAVLGGAAAAYAALRQLRIQQHDSARLTRQLEREQANDVNAGWLQGDHVRPETPQPGMATTAGRAVVFVSNHSKRPIRSVTSLIRQETGPVLHPAQLGPLLSNDHPTIRYLIANPRPGTEVAVIRPKFTYGFVFDYTIPDDDATHPENRAAHPIIQFTDDVGLRWEIDDDLRLKPLASSRDCHRRFRCRER